MRKMRYYKAAILFFIAFLIQTTILGGVSIRGVSPNLLLCLVVVFSFLYDESYGLILGIVFGLLLDLSTQTLFGIQTITFVAAGIPPLIFRRLFNRERVLPDILMALIATPINVFAVWFAYHLTGSPVKIDHAVGALPGLLISHAVIVCILHLLLVRTIIRHKRDRKYLGGTA
ncbi:MAG: rod shape-determining protein MreD [Clostridiales Family XIII bacterium]|jgi:rod shape-determining protein MreD|nr:rod shape-determining protein MreD [Clostridiales Family XIII bacterium]